MMKIIFGISGIVLVLSAFSLESAHGDAAFAVGIVAGVIGLVTIGIYHARKEGY